MSKRHIVKVKGGFKLKAKHSGAWLDRKPESKKKVESQEAAIEIAKAKGK